MQNDNITQVLTRFIAELKIPVTRQSIIDELQIHPDHNSLLAISDLLSNWHVPNAAYHLAFEQLADLPLPFIAHLASRGEFAVVTQLDEEQAIISNESFNNYTFPINEFKQLFSGSVLVAEKIEESGEINYAKKRRKEIFDDWRMPTFFTGAFILLIGFLLLRTTYINTFSLQIGLATLFKALGLVATILLLIQSVDADNPLIQKLCGGNNTVDCNAILSSKAARLFDVLSWSEVGFFYFAGTWIVLLFNSSSIPLIQMLAILNLMCLPYTFYSIYYQWRVAKQWCTFCCAVQALLWLEFFALLPYLHHRLQMLNIQQLGRLATGMLAPVLIWVLVKPYLLQAKQIEPLKRQLRKLKYNTQIFNHLLHQQPKFAIPDEEWSILLGNVEASTIIIMVTNPFCPPCAKTHKLLDELLLQKGDMQARIVFTANNKDNDIKTPVSRHLMALNNLSDKTIVRKALRDWYEQKQKNYETWAKVYPIELNEVEYKIEKQKEWRTIADITSTPTIFINGHRMPELYRLEDIKYLI